MTTPQRRNSASVAAGRRVAGKGPRLAELAWLGAGVLLGMLHGLRRSPGQYYRLPPGERELAAALADLNHAQERYAALFENSLDCIYVHDFDGRFLDANPAALQMAGYTRAELRSMDLAHLLRPDYLPVARQWIEFLRTGRSMDRPVEFGLTTKDGRDLMMEVRAALVLRDGRPCAIEGMARDITERKRMEASLRETEEKFRLLAENAHAAIGIVQGERFVYANRYFAQLSGYSVDELLTLDFPQLVHPSFRPAMLDRARRRQSGQSVPTNYEFLMLTKNGAARWIDFSSALMDYRGQPAIIGTGFDITERKAAEAALRDSETRLRLLCDTATRLIAAEHPEGILGDIFGAVAHYLNAAVFINYLVTPDRARLHLNAWEGLDAAAAQALEFAEFGQSYCGTCALERRRISVPEVQTCREPKAALLQPLGIRVYACFPLLDHAVLGTIAFAARDRDRFTEEQLELMQVVADQVSMALVRQQLNAELRARATALDQAARAKDHFLAVLSHELRNPLTPVLATVALLQEEPSLSADICQQLAVIHRNAELEARLIDDLLDVTRLQRGKMELHRQVVDLRQVITHAVEVCQPDIAARDLNFHWDPGPHPCLVYADPVRLQQVFWNLLKNALKFTPHGQYVGIDLQTGGTAAEPQATGPPTAWALVAVEDGGVGIEPDVLPRIFNAFEQGEAGTTRQFGGLGLGLAISKAIVEMHGGAIAAASPGKGQGARFTVTLPLWSRPAPLAPPVPVNSPVPAAPHPLHILLVEDHGDTARIMSRILQTKGHTVHVAGDVASALALAAAQPFDLLLSDLGLPDGTGLNLMAELRRRGSTLPGIALSGYGQEEDIRRSQEAGFLAHLTKPVAIEGLLETIATLAP